MRTQPAFELAWGFAVFTVALSDAALDVGMLMVPPVGQNVHRETILSTIVIIRGFEGRLE